MYKYTYLYYVDLVGTQFWIDVMSVFISSGSIFTGIISPGKNCILASFCARCISCGRTGDVADTGGEIWTEGGGVSSLHGSADEVGDDGSWSGVVTGLWTGLPCSSTLLVDDDLSSETFLFTIFVQSVGRSSIPIPCSVCPMRYRTVSLPHSLPILQSFFSCTSYGLTWWINFPFLVVDMVYFPAVTLYASFFVAWLKTVSDVFRYSCFT